MPNEYSTIKFRDTNQLKKRFEKARIQLMDNGRKPSNAETLDHLLTQAGLE